ncbi:hypothetical protein AWENTII_005303 [Aspergillus wentii]
MGNSVANYGQSLVAVDACQQESRIVEADDSDQEALREFGLNGLRHANSIMGQ